MYATIYPIFRVPMGYLSRFYIFLLASVLALQFALVSFTFPLDELTSDKPVFYYDTAFHWYEIWFAQALWESERLVGYDPYFSAGLVNGVTLNMSAKAAALLASLAGPDMTAAEAFKWFAFVSAVIAPACVTIACYWLGIPRFVALVAAFFSIITWWATDFRAFYSIGMVAFAAASFLALPYAALSLRYLTNNESSKLALIGLAVGAALAIFYHPLFPIPTVFAVVALAFAFWRKLDLNRVLLYCLIVPLTSVLVNAFWILDLLSYSRGQISGGSRGPQ